MMTRSMIVAMVLAATLPAGASASSFDFNGREVQTEIVRASDLDLSTGWGMDKLIHRLRSRIDNMCGWDMDCRDEAWLSADWQVARALSRDQWRRRIATERANDRRDYRWRRSAPGQGGDRRVYRFELDREPGPGQFAPPPAAAAGPPPGAVPVGKEVTTTTRTYTVKTTTVRVIYRLPPVDGGTWTPRCRCER